MCEVFSPPQVGLEAAKFGIKVGDALDLTTGLHFTRDEDCRRAEEYVDREQPSVLIGSPPCVAFSQLQSLNPDSDNKARQLADGIKHMQFVARLYKKQVQAGRLFVHESPAHAKSCSLPCIRKMLRETGVEVVEADQCMFGLKTWGAQKSQLVPAKKPTKFMTNSRVIGHEFNRKCDGGHVHQPLIDGRAKDAARYPPALCRAIFRGIAKEKMQRAHGVTAVLSIGAGLHMATVDVEEHHEREEVDIEALIRKIEGASKAVGAPGRHSADARNLGCRLGRLTQYRNKQGEISSTLAVDDLTGMKLDAGKVVEAFNSVGELIAMATVCKKPVKS